MDRENRLSTLEGRVAVIAASSEEQTILLQGLAEGYSALVVLKELVEALSLQVKNLTEHVRAQDNTIGAMLSAATHLQ